VARSAPDPGTAYPRRAMTYRGVFFDAGETLVHPHPSFIELLVQMLRREGHDVGAVDLHENAAIVAEHFRRAADEGLLWTTSPQKSKAFWLGVYREFLARLGIDGGDELPERLYRTFTDVSNYRLFPDVLPVLEDLRSHELLVGVISNFEEWLGRLLAHVGVAELLDVQVVSGLEGVEKPDPAIFVLALERAGLPAGQCVYVGDNPVFDTEPAEALGMRGVLIDRRGRFPDYAGPGVRITDLADLPAAIGLRRPARAAAHRA
jgi:putative hydrolase of the HAD superfamily